MIVSHRHKFIFVHLGRTSGTSIAHMLKPFLGPDDIVAWRPKRWWNRNHFHRHDTAHDIKRKVGEAVWNEYFKFTFERNPFEKILTKYWAYAGADPRHFYKRIPQHIWGEPMSFAAWFRAVVWVGRMARFGRIAFPRHYHCYASDDEVLVNFIGRFENRKEHLRIIGERLGLPIDVNYHIGNSRRKARIPYVQCYDAWMRQVVEDYYRRDLRFLGYRFGEPDPTNVIWDQAPHSTSPKIQSAA